MIYVSLEVHSLCSVAIQSKWKCHKEQDSAIAVPTTLRLCKYTGNSCAADTGCAVIATLFSYI